MVFFFWVYMGGVLVPAAPSRKHDGFSQDLVDQAVEQLSRQPYAALDKHMLHSIVSNNTVRVVKLRGVAA